MRRIALPCVLTVTLAIALAGADRVTCTPVPVEDGVTIETSREFYHEGERIEFTVDPAGTTIYVQNGEMNEPWFIERRDPATGTWQRITAWMPMGCYATECIDGQALWLCADPAPPWCEEHVEPFTQTWRAQEWIFEEVECGREAVPMWRSVPARAGSYRITQRYGLDGMEAFDDWHSYCLDQGESVEDTFTIAGSPMP